MSAEQVVQYIASRRGHPANFDFIYLNYVEVRLTRVKALMTV